MPATVCSFIFLTILIVTFVLSKGRLFKKGTSQETCHIFILRYIPGVRNKILQFSVCQIACFYYIFCNDGDSVLYINLYKDYNILKIVSCLLKIAYKLYICVNLIKYLCFL